MGVSPEQGPTRPLFGVLYGGNLITADRFLQTLLYEVVCSSGQGVDELST